MSSPPVRVAVLDMAGTTLSDDGLVTAAARAAFDAVGIGPDHPDAGRHLAEFDRRMGQAKDAVFLDLLGDEALVAPAMEAFEASYLEAVGDGAAQPLPGADETLRRLRDLGVRTCLTTGFPVAIQEALVERVGWADVVDLWLAPVEGLRGRPFPDLVLTAAVRLEADDVREVAVVGDTTNDLVAGTRAGAGVVAGVLSGAHGRAALEAAPHTHVLDTVVEFADVVAAGRS